MTDPTNTEGLLFKRYIATDGPEGPGPLRYVDATESSLREALCLDTGADPIAALVLSCGPEARIRRVFADGVDAIEDGRDFELGVLRYLVLACAVAARDEPGENNFRVKLARSCGVEIPFANIAGLPAMWRELRDWCEGKRAEGARIRKLILPDPRGQRFVGHTTRLAFPSWRDVAQLGHLVIRTFPPDGPDSSHRRVALELAPRVTRARGFSDVLVHAADDFVRWFDIRSGLLDEHRFWKAFQAAEKRRPALDRAVRDEVGLCMIDGPPGIGPRFELTAVPSNHHGGETVSGDVDTVLSTLKDWYDRSRHGANRSLVGRMTACGIVTFRLEGPGAWAATTLDPELEEDCIAVCDRTIVGELAQAGVRTFSLGRDWHRTNFLDAERCRMLAQFGSTSRTDDFPHGRRRAIALVGACRASDGALLGRRSLLPLVDAGPVARVCAHRIGDDEPISVIPMKSPANHHQLNGGDLKGSLRVIAEERLDGSDAAFAERALEFRLDAAERDRLPEPDEERWEIPNEIEAMEASPDEVDLFRLGSDAFDALEDVREDGDAHDDFVEAIYGATESGRRDAPLAELARRVFGRDGPSPWDLLRALEEGNWLRSTRAHTWRARRWWLLPPTLRPVGRDATALIGSAPRVLRRQFAQAAAGMGGTVREWPRSDVLGPRRPIAVGVSANELSMHLHWPVENFSQRTFLPAPRCWPENRADPEAHESAFRWDWERGLFQSSPHCHEVCVALERHSRDRGDRADLFTVATTGSEGVFDTRTIVDRCVAVTEAYRRARRAFLKRTGGLLLRVPRDGHLPLALAMRVNGHFRASGPVHIDGDWRYAYPDSDDGRRAATHVYGVAFVDDPLRNASRDATFATALIRRRHVAPSSQTSPRTVR